MTTPLTKDVKRISTGRHFGRRFVVTIASGDVIGFRSERTRKTYWTTLAACFDMSVKQHVDAERAAKKKARKAARK